MRKKTIKKNLNAIRYSLFASRSGFTIIELIVAMSIFTVLITAVTISFIRIMSAQRITAALLAVNSNTSLAIEQMMREIRTGAEFVQGGGFCASNIRFFNNRGEEVEYRLAGGTIDRVVGIGGGPLTAENVNVRDLQFCLFGTEPDDGYPPRITIAVAVSPVAGEAENVVVNLQTTVSAREWDD